MKSLSRILLIGTALLLLLLLICVPDVSGQENNKWEAIKIPEGGFVSSIAIAPENPNTVYAGTVGVGAFKTTNGGGTWHAMAHVNSLDFVYMTLQLAIDPTNPKIIYLLPQAGLYKSEDQGATWHHIREAVGNNTCIAISPSNSKVIYLGTFNGDVSRSEDGGKTWKRRLRAGLPNPPNRFGRKIPLQVFALAVHPENPAHVYLGTNGGGIYQSTNAGESWQKTSAGLTNEVIHDIKINPTNPSVLYAATEGGVFDSMDGGQNWQSINTGLTDLTVGCLTIAPTNPRVLYAGVYNGDGVFQSEDGGLTWQQRNHGLTGRSTFTLSVDPTAPQIVYAGMAFGEDGVFKSTDGGVNWQPINHGLNGRNVGALVVSPTNSEVVYASTSSGILKTADGGGTWQFMMKGVRFANHYHTISYLGTFAKHLFVPPNNPSVIYASMVADANLENGGFFKSVDGGHQWQELMKEVPIRWVRQVAFHKKNPDIIYLAINSGEIYRSLDAGNRWERRGQLEFIESLIVDQENPELLYAGSPGLAADTLLYQSWDGGQNWRKVSSIEGLPSDLVQHPDKPEILYYTTTGGLYKSEDRGRGWKRIKTPQEFNYQVILDAANPDHIYLGGSKGILKSMDAGRSWEPLLLSSSVHDLVLSRTNPRRAYASGYGWIRRLTLPPLEFRDVAPADLWVTLLGHIKHSVLLQNFPNPFNPETWIPYVLAEDAPVTIQIYNVGGGLVRQLSPGQKPTGAYVTKDTAAYWDGRNAQGEAVASGLYFFRLRAGEFTATRRMLLMK